GPSARHLDVAGRRRRLPAALAACQIYVLASSATALTRFNEPYRKRRAWNLAATLLGAHIARRGGFQPARRLCSLQSREARACLGRAGLAAFVIPPVCPPWCSAGRLGR